MNAAKAVSAGLGGAVSTIIIWALNQYAHAQIPDIVQGAITTVVSTALAYFVPNADAAIGSAGGSSGKIASG